MRNTSPHSDIVYCNINVYIASKMLLHRVQIVCLYMDMHTCVCLLMYTCNN